jgi:hypothetical protein
MKLQLNPKFTYGFTAFKTLLNNMTNLLSSLCVGSARMKYVAPGSLVMYFDSAGNQADEYLTVAQLSQLYPAFTQGSIRWLIFNGEKNGFNKVVRKLGRKIILNLREFRLFIEKQSQQ